MNKKKVHDWSAILQNEPLNRGFGCGLGEPFHSPPPGLLASSTHSSFSPKSPLIKGKHFKERNLQEFNIITFRMRVLFNITSLADLVTSWILPGLENTFSVHCWILLLSSCFASGIELDRISVFKCIPVGISTLASKISLIDLVTVEMIQSPCP